MAPRSVQSSYLIMSSSTKSIFKSIVSRESQKDVAILPNTACILITRSEPRLRHTILLEASAPTDTVVNLPIWSSTEIELLAPQSAGGLRSRFRFRSLLPRPQALVNMCEYTRNYYVYSNCTDPAMHFTRTSTEGNAKKKCAKAPHERFIVVSGTCNICR